MKPVSLPELLDAAVYALISTRCQQAYLHEARGGLQALQSAIELLARSTTSTAHTAIAEKSVALARRSMSNHEKSLIELFHQMWPQKENEETVNLTVLIEDVLRFLRNDASSKSITLKYRCTSDVMLAARPQKMRTVVLGLCIMSIDDLPPGADIDIALSSDGTHALLELQTIMSCVPVPTSPAAWRITDFPLPPYELLLAVIARWLADAGGSLEQQALEHGTRLQIRQPLRAVS